MIRGPRPLLGLHAAVARGRFRLAVARDHGVTASAAGWFASLFGVLMMVVSATILGVVSASLVTTLARRGEPHLAAGVAGGLADVCLFLAILAVVLQEPLTHGLDPRPLSVLPLRRRDLFLAELIALTTLHPAALVIWTLILSLSAGLLATGLSAFLLALPAIAAAGTACATAALVARALQLEMASQPPSRVIAPLGKLALCLLPVMVLLGHDGNWSGWIQRYTDGHSPGAWLARALVDAWGGSLRAWTFALALAALSLSLFALAWRVRLPLLSLGATARRGTGRRALARIWGLPRALPLLLQSVTLVTVLLALADLLQRRGFAAPWIAPAVSISAGWLIASAPAPLLSNLLGLGGTAGLVHGLTPLGWRRLLAESALIVWIVPALVTTLTCLLIGVILGDRSGAFVGWLIGQAQLALGVAVGSLVSLRWPWPMELKSIGEPLWGVGPARLVVPLAQSLPLVTAFEPLRTGESFVQAALFWWVMSTLLGLFGLTCATWLVDRQKRSVSELLLS